MPRPDGRKYPLRVLVAVFLAVVVAKFAADDIRSSAGLTVHDVRWNHRLIAEIESSGHPTQDVLITIHRNERRRRAHGMGVGF